MTLRFGNDPDYDRHGIVTPKGLMNPNHYLAVCIDYLYRHRQAWGKDVAVGKTLVSSALIDRVVADLGRELCEVPVGFKWFVDGLYEGNLVLVVKKVQVLLSYVKTEHLGRRIKTASFCVC